MLYRGSKRAIFTPTNITTKRSLSINSVCIKLFISNIIDRFINKTTGGCTHVIEHKHHISVRHCTTMHKFQCSSIGVIWLVSVLRNAVDDLCEQSVAQAEEVLDALIARPDLLLRLQTVLQVGQAAHTGHEGQQEVAAVTVCHVQEHRPQVLLAECVHLAGRHCQRVVWAQASFGQQTVLPEMVARPVGGPMHALLVEQHLQSSKAEGVHVAALVCEGHAHLAGGQEHHEVAHIAGLVQVRVC